MAANAKSQRPFQENTTLTSHYANNTLLCQLKKMLKLLNRFFIKYILHLKCGICNACVKFFILSMMFDSNQNSNNITRENRTASQYTNLNCRYKNFPFVDTKICNCLSLPQCLFLLFVVEKFMDTRNKSFDKGKIILKAVWLKKPSFSWRALNINMLAFYAQWYIFWAVNWQWIS